jgi:membrane protease subunit (stomatin/prohibitin family)
LYLRRRYAVPHVPWKRLAERQAARQTQQSQQQQVQQAEAQHHASGSAARDADSNNNSGAGSGGPQLTRFDWRGLVARLLGLAYDVSELTLPILSKPQASAMALPNRALLIGNCVVAAEAA